MNPVSLDFVEAAPSSGPAAATAPFAESGPVVSDGFGDLLQEFLAQAIGATANVPVEGRGRARRGNDAEVAHGTDADKDGDSEPPSSTDVVTLFATIDLVRTMPVPPPPTEPGDAIDETFGDQQKQEMANDELSDAIEVLEVPTDVDAPAEADLEQTTTNAAVTTPGAEPIVDPRAQKPNRAPSTPVAVAKAPTAPAVTTKAAKLATSQPQAAASLDKVSNQTPPAEPHVAEPQWRQAMMAWLADLIESPSDPSSTPASRSSVPATVASEIARALSSMADEASTEHRSIVATSLNASGAGQTSEIERLASLDQHMQTPVLQYRLDPSMTAPLRLAVDTATAASAAPMVVFDEPTLDAHLPEQIVQSIRIQALDLGGEARVRLRPEYLGEVVVSVKVDRGAVTATLQADTPAVRRWIETHEASLRVGLADQGLHLDRLIVSEPAKSEPESGERRRQPSQEQPARQEPRRTNRDEDAPTFEVVV